MRSILHVCAYLDMGYRKFRLAHRKNDERKRLASQRVKNICGRPKKACGRPRMACGSPRKEEDIPTEEVNNPIITIHYYNIGDADICTTFFGNFAFNCFAAIS